MASERLDTGAVLGGRYVIIAAVGRGGMGAVYQARDTRLDCVVAVKELHDRYESEDERAESVRLFEREARLLAQLSHPNLPRVSDYFVENGRCYLVMEFIEGENLEGRQERDGKVSLLAALEWAVQLADALTYLHEQIPPIVFRDLKPANVMITASGTAKLIDFGIARRFQQGASKDTLLYGSPGYSPPEQYGRAQTDPRADIYALGATLHHLVTGRDPAPTPFKFPTIRSLDPSLPPALDTLIERCVEMDEAKRIQTAKDVRTALNEIRDEMRARARKSGVENQGPGRRRPNLARAVAVVLLLVVLAGIGAVWMRQPRANTTSTGVVTPSPSNPAGQSPTTTRQTGSIQIESEPSGAVVNLDGKEVGTTPFEARDLQSGRYLVDLMIPGSSGDPWSREVEVKPGENVLLQAQISRSSEPQPGPAKPAATVELLKAQASPIRAPNPRNLEPGLYISLGFRVSDASSKVGSAGAYFFQRDGITPLGAPAHAGPYKDSSGQLHCAASIQIDSDPTDFANFTLSIPEWAFPPDSGPITWRVLVHVDGKQVYRSEPAPVPSGR